MSQQWYYLIDNEEHGPISVSEMKTLALNGTITPDTKVRTDETQPWSVASKVSGLEFKLAPKAAAPTACPPPLAPAVVESNSALPPLPSSQHTEAPVQAKKKTASQHDAVQPVFNALDAVLGVFNWLAVEIIRTTLAVYNLTKYLRMQVKVQSTKLSLSKAQLTFGDQLYHARIGEEQILTKIDSLSQQVDEKSAKEEDDDVIKDLEKECDQLKVELSKAEISEESIPVSAKSDYEHLTTVQQKYSLQLDEAIEAKSEIWPKSKRGRRRIIAGTSVSLAILVLTIALAILSDRANLIKFLLWISIILTAAFSAYLLDKAKRRQRRLSKLDDSSSQDAAVDLMHEMHWPSIIAGSGAAIVLLICTIVFGGLFTIAFIIASLIFVIEICRQTIDQEQLWMKFSPLASLVLIAPVVYYGFNPIHVKEEEQDNRISKLPEDATTEQITEAYKDRVYFIRTMYTSSGRSAGNTGSGVLIANNSKYGLLVTNRHVVDPSFFNRRFISLANIGFSAKNPNQEKFKKVRLAAIHTKHDLALLLVEDDFENTDSIEIVSRKKIKQAEQALAMGNPRGIEFIVTDGTVSGQINKDLLMHSCPTSPGNSGGPLFIRRYGRLAGIVTSGRIDQGSQNMNFATQADLLTTSLNKQGELPLKWYRKALQDRGGWNWQTNWDTFDALKYKGTEEDRKVIEEHRDIVRSLISMVKTIE